MKPTIKQRISSCVTALEEIDNDLELQIISENEPTKVHYLYRVQNTLYNAIAQLKKIRRMKAPKRMKVLMGHIAKAGYSYPIVICPTQGIALYMMHVFSKNPKYDTLWIDETWVQEEIPNEREE